MVAPSGGQGNDGEPTSGVGGSATVSERASPLRLSPIPDHGLDPHEARRAATNSSLAKPCRGCDGDEALDDISFQLIESEDVRLLKDMTAARRRPEDPPGMSHYQERLAQLNNERGQSPEEALRAIVTRKFQDLVPLVNDPSVWSVFLYDAAFDCGIPPESLLKAPSETGRKTIEWAATAIRSPERLEATPTLADPAERNNGPVRPDKGTFGLPPALRAFAVLSDSDEKAVLLAKTYLTYRESHPEIARSCLQLLSHVPSPKAVKMLEEHLQKDSLNEDERLGLVQAIADSRTEASVPALIAIVIAEKRLTRVSSCACLGLAKWDFRRNVLELLRNRLMERDAEPIREAIGSLWGVTGGRKALSDIASGAASLAVRRRAVRELGYNSREPAVAATLWRIAADQEAADELRALALGALSGEPTPEQNALLDKWAKKRTALGEVAKHFNAPASEPADGDLSRDLQHYVRARDFFERSRTALAEKKGQLTADERAALLQLDSEIKEVTALIEKTDPKGELRAEAGPSDEFIRLQRKISELSRQTEDYGELPQDPDEAAELAAIQDRLRVLEKQRQKLDPKGVWLKKYERASRDKAGASRLPPDDEAE
jgi:hypothetical protein